jgi:hypothetical protein
MRNVCCSASRSRHPDGFSRPTGGELGHHRRRHGRPLTASERSPHSRSTRLRRRRPAPRPPPAAVPPRARAMVAGHRADHPAIDRRDGRDDHDPPNCDFVEKEKSVSGKTGKPASARTCRRAPALFTRMSMHAGGGMRP